MPQESPVLKFFMMVFGNAFYSHMHFIDRLGERLHLKEAVSEDNCNVIIAFVAVASRAGTDIEAALQEIPASSRPVVLVVLHHTFDPHFIAPDSRLCVNRGNVFTVDCLFHEDRGLLRCLHNDEALKAVTNHLISNGASAKSQEGIQQGINLLPRNLQVISTQCLQQLSLRNKTVITGLIIGVVSGGFIGLVGVVAGLFLGGGIGAVSGYLVHFCLYQREMGSSSVTMV